MAQNLNKHSLKKIRQLQYSMVIGYAVIVAAAILIVSVLAVHKTDKVLKNKVSSMTSSLNQQMKLNLDGYLSRMETIGTLAFAVDEAYTYDATDPDNDEYESITTEKIISDKLYSLCIMENFVDYGIVYRNNHVVGKLSNGTKNLFGNNIFNDLHGMISNQRTHDGWAAGHNGDFRRIYYVKSIHENALLVISFYTTELEQVFENPDTLSDMIISLTDSDYNIIYSSGDAPVGSPLPDYLIDRIGSRHSATFIDNDYLITSSICGDEWYVICSIPTSIILKEKNEMRVYIYMIGFLAVILSTLIAFYLSTKLIKPVKHIVSALDTKAHIDQLTGILNKLSFEESTKSRLTNSLSFEQHALLLLDLDNFKGVNDTLGHSYGDLVLTKVGSILRACFSAEDYLGRVGGDEFAVFINYQPDDDMDYTSYVKSKCDELCEAFRNNYTGRDNDYKISGSIGVALFPDHAETFEELYKFADTALYISKNKGKDTYTIFDPEHTAEVTDR